MGLMSDILGIILLAPIIPIWTEVHEMPKQQQVEKGKTDKGVIKTKRDKTDNLPINPVTGKPMNY